MIDKIVIGLVVAAAVYYLYRRFKQMTSPDGPSCGCGGGCGCDTVPTPGPEQTGSSDTKSDTKKE